MNAAKTTYCTCALQHVYMPAMAKYNFIFMNNPTHTPYICLLWQNIILYFMNNPTQ